MQHYCHSKLVSGTIGVQNGDDEPHYGQTKVVQQPVQVTGDLCQILQHEEESSSSSASPPTRVRRRRRRRYGDKVQVFTFDQFMVHENENEDEAADNKNNSSSNYHDTTTTTSSGDDGDDDDLTTTTNNNNEGNYKRNVVSLRQVMERLRPQIENEPPYLEEENDDYDEGDEDDDDPRERALLYLHDVLVPVVREILQDHELYASQLARASSSSSSQNKSNSSICIRRYAKPTYRNDPSHYANYLHNDAWWKKNDDDVDHDNDDDDTAAPPPLAMVNLWLVLNDVPPSNTLVFWETNLPSRNVRPSHMLHATATTTCTSTNTDDGGDDDGVVVVYDRHMAWGRLYAFVAGQRQCAATTTKQQQQMQQSVLLHGAMEVGGGGDQGEIRRSVELRYTVHLQAR